MLENGQNASSQLSILVMLGPCFGIRTRSSELFIIPPATKLGGGVYWNHPVRPSVCPSVRPSVDARLGKMVSSA